MLGFSMFAIALLTITNVFSALRIRPVRALQRLAQMPDPAREQMLDDYAKRLADKHDHHN